MAESSAAPSSKKPVQLRRILIENYRGIGKLDLAIGETTVFIGENNCGKTSVLRAVGACLRELGPRRRTGFQQFDFHLENADSEPSTAPPITISLTFREDVADEWERGPRARLNRAKVLQIDDKGRACVVLQVVGRYDEATRDFVATWRFLNVDDDEIQGVSEGALKSVQQLAEFFYLAALRDAAAHFDARGEFWRPFLKAGDLDDARRQEIEEKLREVNDLVVGSHENFEKACGELHRLQEVISMESESLVSVEAIPGRVFEMLAKAQIRFKAATGAGVPVRLHGEGTQSLAVLLLFSAFLESWAGPAPIIALEEPEAHLHPSAIRALWKVVHALPGQKLISTHSGDLLSEVPIESIVRLASTDDGIKAFVVPGDLLDEEERRKLDYHIRRSRGELLFARAWLLVEGESDVWIYPAAARATGHDFHRSGVRVVDYSQSDLKLLIKVARALGIRWFCVADDDLGRAKYEKALNKVLKREPSEDEFSCPYVSIEVHLLKGEHRSLYEAAMPDQNRKKLTTEPSDARYAEDFAANLPEKHKTRVAARVASAMVEGGSETVSTEIAHVVAKIVELARAAE